MIKCLKHCKTILVFILLIASLANAGLIFDNGVGSKDDTLVVQFCFLDSISKSYSTWDTAFVVQAYGSVDFNIDTLTIATGYDLNSVYPRSLMFEYRVPAYDGTADHTGAYTWWVLVKKGGYQQMHYGSYYVNSDPVEDFLVRQDSVSFQNDRFFNGNAIPDSSGYLKIAHSEGGVKSVSNGINVTAINGDSTNGYNATLKLKMLDLHNTTGSYGMRVQSDVGEGLYVTSNAANANAARFAGQGSGAGLSFQAGSVGPGIIVSGGSTSGNGIQIQTRQGTGLNIINTDSGNVVALSTPHGDGINISSVGDGHFGIRVPNVDTAFANVVWNDSTSKHGARHYTMGDSLLKLGGNGSGGGAGIGDSTIARIDSIRWAVGMPMSVVGEKYSDNLHKKIGAYSGLFGDNNNIKDDIGAISLLGNGTEACTLVAREGGMAPILGSRIVIRTLDQTATRVPGLFTDVNGGGIVELDPAAYFVSITANNYFPLADTILVNRDSTWHFSMILFDPGAPSSPDLCRVYGWVYDITGLALANVEIKAEIPPNYQPVKYGDIIITPFEKSTVTDSSGYWQIDLIPNSRLSDPDSKYQFVIEYPSGVVFKSKASVPDSTSWQFR